MTAKRVAARDRVSKSTLPRDMIPLLAPHLPHAQSPEHDWWRKYMP